MFWNLSKAQDKAELRIDGAIVDDNDVWLCEWFGEQCASPNTFRDQIKECGNAPMDVWIKSPGGDVIAAIGMYNAITAYPGPVNVKVEYAASAASMIAMAGDTVEATPGSLMMIHNPVTGAEGTAEQLRRSANALDEVKAAIINTYEKKTGLNRDKLSAMMDDETWMSAQTAVKYGFADSISGEQGTYSNFSRTIIMNSARQSTMRIMSQCRPTDQELRQERELLLLEIDLI